MLLLALLYSLFLLPAVAVAALGYTDGAVKSATESLQLVKSGRSRSSQKGAMATTNRGARNGHTAERPLLVSLY